MSDPAEGGGGVVEAKFFKNFTGEGSWGLKMQLPLNAEKLENSGWGPQNNSEKKGSKGLRYLSGKKQIKESVATLGGGERKREEGGKGGGNPKG